jgi:hypothetical protein
MLFPFTRSWTRPQKWFIVTAAALALVLVSALIYTYERYRRGPTDSVFFGTWEMEGVCMDCTFFLTLLPDHNVRAFGEADPELRWPAGGGRWYAGGQLLVVHYATDEGVLPLVMRIVDIAPDVIRVRTNGHEVRMLRSTHTPPEASNQAMERTADRFASAF